MNEAKHTKAKIKKSLAEMNLQDLRERKEEIETELLKAKSIIKKGVNPYGGSTDLDKINMKLLRYELSLILKQLNKVLIND